MAAFEQLGKVPVKSLARKAIVVRERSRVRGGQNFMWHCASGLLGDAELLNLLVLPNNGPFAGRVRGARLLANKLLQPELFKPKFRVILVHPEDREEEQRKGQVHQKLVVFAHELTKGKKSKPHEASKNPEKERTMLLLSLGASNAADAP